MVFARSDLVAKIKHTQLIDGSSFSAWKDSNLPKELNSKFYIERTSKKLGIEEAEECETQKW